MPVSEQSLSDSPNAMESDDRNDPLDTFIGQAIAREQSPQQWMHLVHPLGHLGLPGWPLLTPLKVQLQKCDKCSTEFCSPMNYRRHIRMHRRSSNIDKESHKNRDLLGAFWDKLSLEEAGKIVSFDDVSLEGVSGSSILSAWASTLQKPGVMILPQIYVKAGCLLLEIIVDKSSRLPISSQDLFSVLDETSEGTFLCAGTVESLQKFVVDGGAEKVLELRNMVASTSLLFEQNLVKAWNAKKDAEALRCQKILVEEEEVAQKRQAETLEKKRRKKLRQKEQKAKGQSIGEKTNMIGGEKMDSHTDSLESIADFVEGSTLAEISIPKFPLDNGSDTVTDLKSSLEQENFTGKEDEELLEALCDVRMDSIKNIGYPKERATNGLYQPTVSTWKVVKSDRRGQVASLGSKNLQTTKLEAMHKPGPANEMNIVDNSGKFRAGKSKSEIHEESSRIIVQNVVAKSANDVEKTRTNLQNVAAKGEIDAENSRTTMQNVVAKGSNDESPRNSWKNVVTRGAIDVKYPRTTLQSVVAKSANVVESSKTSLQKVVAKGAIDAESSRTSLQSVVSKSSNDESAGTILQNIVYKGAIVVKNSRTSLQNVVAKSENDVESSRTSLQNVIAKGAIDVERSRTTLQNVVAKNAGDVEGSGASSQNVVSSHTDMSNRKLLIGSISVPVKKNTAEQHVSQGATTDSSDKCAKSDAVPKEQDPSVAMMEDVSVYEMRGDLPVQRGNEKNREKNIVGTVEDQTVTSLQSFVAKLNVNIINNENSYTERNAEPGGPIFPSFDVKAFLAQRWKAAMASDHVKLVLSPEPPCDADGGKDCSLPVQTSGSRQCSDLDDAEALVAGVGPHVSFNKEDSKAKFRKKTKKGGTNKDEV